MGARRPGQVVLGARGDQVPDADRALLLGPRASRSRSSAWTARSSWRRWSASPSASSISCSRARPCAPTAWSRWREIVTSTARLIVNRASLKTAHARVSGLIERCARRPARRRARRADREMIRRLDTRALGDRGRGARARPPALLGGPRSSARASPEILAAVRGKGDAALLELHRALRPRVALARPSCAVTARRARGRRARGGRGDAGARSATPPSASSASTRVRAAVLEHDATTTARCWARRCGRSSASRSTCRAAAPPIRPPC